jgi:MFS family permease
MFSAVSSYVQKDFEGADSSGWYIVSYLILMAAVSPLGGMLSDLLSRRKLVFAGMLCMDLGLFAVLFCKDLTQLTGKGLQ